MLKKGLDEGSLHNFGYNMLCESYFKLHYTIISIEVIHNFFLNWYMCVCFGLK